MTTPLLGDDESSWLLCTDELRARRQQIRQAKRKLCRVEPTEDVSPAEDQLGSPEKIVFGMALRKTRSRRLNQVFSPRRNAKNQSRRRAVQGVLAKRVVQDPAQPPAKLRAHGLNDQKSPRKFDTSDDGRRRRPSPVADNRSNNSNGAGQLLSPLSGAQAAVAEALKEWDLDHAHAPCEGTGPPAASAPSGRWTTASTVVAASALGFAALLARRVR